MRNSLPLLYDLPGTIGLAFFILKQVVDSKTSELTGANYASERGYLKSRRGRWTKGEAIHQEVHPVSAFFSPESGLRICSRTTGSSLTSRWPTYDDDCSAGPLLSRLPLSVHRRWERTVSRSQ
ncbi:hypothetical protein CDAR_311041 [Caerostris darwini]|uniref:Uncharacterized protein n=1 Tax=Caerostris darwini TaxID=1538125 RepID=A0AAV4WUF2_9ARAC|nr:hypothetical protein CDAR_311041 [Caerostris darwini]